MAGHLLLVSVFASVVGFLLLYAFIVIRNSQKHLTVIGDGNSKNGSSSTACKKRESQSADVIIVGAGVAGTALAHTLGKEGRRVHLIERDLRQPDRIVGEVLQPGGYLSLIQLGLKDCVENIDAQRVVGYALFKNGKNTRLPYPLDKFDADVAGRGFHNGRFIQKMRDKASSLPNVELEQGIVSSLVEEKGVIRGVVYRTKTGEEKYAYAPLTIVCDGCFSNLRRSLCTPQVEFASCFVGLILENCQLPYENHGHIILADPSPIVFYPISSTEIRCLVDVPGQKVPSASNGDLSNYLKTIVAPQIPSELQDGFIASIDKGKMKVMPNRSMPAAPHLTPGALLMGDALNMRHPLTGGGMTVALSDVVVLCDLLRPLNGFHDPYALCRYLESFYTLRKPVSSTINTLAEALYKVFCASRDEAWQEMQEACFEYLRLGGIFSNGPISLISGLYPSPLSLLLHFFAVALYGVGRLLLPFPSPRGIWTSGRLIWGAFRTVCPIIKAEGFRQTFFPATVPAYYRDVPMFADLGDMNISSKMEKSQP